MIEKKLQDKVDEVVADAVETEVLDTNPAINPQVEESIKQTEIAPEPPQPSVLESNEPVADNEPVEVAGLGNVARKALDGLKDRTLEAERRVTMEADEPPPIREVEQSLVIAPADPDEVKLINEQLGGEYTKGLNFPDILASSGDFDAADYLARFKDANQELFEQARRGTISFDRMLEMAQERGLDQIVYDLTRRSPGDVLPPEDFLAGMLAYSQLMNQSRGAWSKAFELPMGPERDAAMTRALQLSTVHSQVAVNLSGTVSEAARTVQLAGELKRRGVPEVSQELTLFGAKTAQDIEYVGRHYLAITNPSAMARFLQKASNSKTLDAISEIWINSILTSPVTHLVNIAGNATYGQLRNLETFLAAGIGKLRTTVGIGGKDRVRAREGLAQLEGIRHAMADAFLMAGKVVVTETPTDLASKIDVRTRRAIGTTGDLNQVWGMARKGEIGPAAVNAFGIYARLGGRALLAEDEFFKALGARSELYRIAEMRAGDIYQTTLETGGTVEDAKRAAALERANIINNPPEEIKKQAAEAARDLTFQGDLDGFLGQMQGALSHPIAKLFVPFYKTPVNIMKATLERSPAAALFPSFYKKLAAGGREADIALAKVSMGSAIMSSFAYASYGLDGPEKEMIIIGNGPQDKDARSAMMRQGFQPYSINILQEDGSYKSITYSRFDPISGVLAMAADFAYYAQYETNQQTLDELAMAMSVGLAEYLIDMPLLQGLSEVQGALMQPNPADKFDALLGLLGQKGTEAVLSVAPGTGAFTAGVARVEDPTARSTMLPEEGLFGEDPTTLPAFARGFYTALQKAKSRNPLFNQDLPPRLNEWGEEVKLGKGVWWEFVSPIRIQDARYTAIDKELMSLGDGIPRTPRKIDGVLLNATQYNEWITMTNQMDSFGRLPGDPKHDASSTLILDVERLILTPEYQELPTKADKMQVIKNLVSERRSAARKILLSRDASLRLKVNSVQ